MICGNGIFQVSQYASAFYSPFPQSTYIAYYAREAAAEGFRDNVAVGFGPDGEYADIRRPYPGSVIPEIVPDISAVIFHFLLQAFRQASDTMEF